MKSLKSFIAVLVALALLICGLAACRSSEDEKNAEEEITSVSQQQETTEKSTEALTEATTEKTTEKQTEKATEKVTSKTSAKTTAKTTAKAAVPQWKSAYRKVLEAKRSEYGQTIGKFALVNIDSNGTPVLLITDSDSHFSQVKVYTYNNGKAVDCGDFGSFGSIGYSKNTVVGVFTSGGGGTTHCITVGEINNGKYRLLFDGKQECADGAPFEFYSGGKVISQDEFKESFDKFIPDSLKSIEVSDSFFSDYMSLFPDLYGCKKVSCSKSEKEFIDLTAENINSALK